MRPLQLPRVYDACFVAAMTLQAVGEALGAYDAIPWFDVVVHFSLPFFLGPALYIALARADVVPDPKDVHERHHYVGVFVISLALGIALGGVWEIWEWVAPLTFRPVVCSGREKRRNSGRFWLRRGDSLWP